MFLDSRHLGWLGIDEMNEKRKERVREYLHTRLDECGILSRMRVQTAVLRCRRVLDERHPIFRSAPHAKRRLSTPPLEYLPFPARYWLRNEPIDRSSSNGGIIIAALLPAKAPDSDIISCTLGTNTATRYVPITRRMRSALFKAGRFAIEATVPLFAHFVVQRRECLGGSSFQFQVVHIVAVSVDNELCTAEVR